MHILPLNILGIVHVLAPKIYGIVQSSMVMYCLLANAISGAKLVKMFEEAKFRCVKVQFFSGSVV